MSVSSKSILVVVLLGLMGTLPGCGGGSTVGDVAEDIFTQGNETELGSTQGLEGLAEEAEQITDLEEEYAEDPWLDSEDTSFDETAWYEAEPEITEEAEESSEIIAVILEQEPAQVSVEVSWDIPTQRENGADLQLSELDGYHIIYQREGSSSPASVYIDSPTQSSEIIHDLEPGDYEFKITAIDTNGLVSEYSQIVATTLQ